jgi:hypothetical protein
MFSFDNVHEELSIMETHMQYDGLFAVIECWPIPVIVTLVC